MSRKLFVLSAAMLTVALSAAGLAYAAAEDHGPAGEAMEGIQKNVNAIRKSIRTPAQWKADAGKVADGAAEIEKLGKETKKIKKYAEDFKKPVAEWEKYSDEMIKAAGDLASVAKKKGSTQAQAKEAFNAVNKSCATCHGVFRKEE